MKKLIISGLGCPKHAWEKVFPSEQNTKIIPLSEVLDNCPHNDLRLLAQSLEPIISSYQPDVIILHDFGVILGLLALTRMQKQGVELKAKLVIFNGSFRGFNVYKTRHPFKIQLANFDLIKKKISKVGGELDESLRKHFSRIKKIYRQVILASTIGLIKNLFKKPASLNLNLGNDILIIASSNDPFIPMDSLHIIANDFKHTHMEIYDYGHFPYSADCQYLRSRIEQFAATKGELHLNCRAE